MAYFTISDRDILGSIIRNIWQHTELDFDAEGQDLLKRCCENYLAYVYRTHDWALNLDEQIFPFVKYSGLHLLDHADAAASKGIPQDQFLREFSVQNYIPMRNRFPFEDEIVKANSGLLYILVLGNHAALIRQHLRTNPAIVPPGGHCRTPLLAALAHRKAGALKELFTPDEDHQLLPLLSTPTSEEVTAVLNTFRGHSLPLLGLTLVSALWFFLSKSTESVSLALLRSGKFPFNATQPGADIHRTPLFHATQLGHSRLVEFLLKTLNQNVNNQENFERTPLSRAAEAGYVNVVEALLRSSEINVNSRSQDGQTPLMYAAERGHERVIQLLLHAPGVDVNTEDNKGRTPLFHAASRGHAGIVRQLLNVPGIEPGTQDVHGRSPLSYAALHGNESTIRLLLDTGELDPNIRDTQGRTPLMLAAQHGLSSIMNVLLQTSGIEADSIDLRGRTAFYYACLGGKYDVINQLLGTKVIDVARKIGSGTTALHYAVENKNARLVKLLLEAHDWNVHGEADESGSDSLLMLAGNAPNILPLLRSHCGCESCAAPQLDVAFRYRRGDSWRVYI